MNNTTNNTKTYKWVASILIIILVALSSFVVGGQVITSTVSNNVRRIDRNEIHIEQIILGFSELKATIKDQNAKLDAINNNMLRIATRK